VRHSSRALFTILLTLAGAATAADENVARFYAGKKISILVGFGPGGSASLYATALSHHMGRFIPGAPTIIAQHMPGAGVVVPFRNQLRGALVQEPESLRNGSCAGLPHV
jgi:tripartite-type tricarboxylate transporter receptor subunit TctC